MKFLILSISLGGGHNQSARVLKEKIEEYGHNAIVYDIFRKNNKSNHIYEKLFYEISFNYPKLYSLLYNIGDTRLSSKLMKIYFLMDSIKLNKIIQENEIDGIICTAPFATQMATTVKKLYNKKLYIMQIVTDLYAQSIYCDELVDDYIVGSSYTVKDLVENKKVSGYKIKNYGIPVRKEFTEYRNFKAHEGINILIMTGSFGFGDVINTIKYIVESDIKNINIKVICGTNENLKNNLIELYGNYSNIEILGYYENIHDIMRESDILISKPSGQTLTESFYMNLPMVIPYYIEGQERKNKEILVDNNLGFEVEKIEEIGIIIQDLIKNKEKYELAKENINRLVSDYNQDKIIELLIEGTKKSKNS